MRILVVTKFYHPRTGGVETTVKQLCEHFVRSGHECTVVAMDRERAGEEEINGISVVRFPVDSRALGGFNRPVWRYLSSSLRQERFDVVNIHQYHILLSAEAALLCRLRRLPYVFTTHYHGKGHTPLRNVLFRLYHPFGAVALRGSRRIICVSEHEKRRLASDFKGLEEKFTVIPAGVKEFPGSAAKRQRDSLLYVGRLMEYKGLDKVLESMAVLRGRRLDVRLRVVGSGPDKERLEKVAENLGVGDRVTWLGDVTEEQLEREYRSAAALVLLSSAEAYGLAVAEALSCGTPCVVADREALTEFLSEPGVFGVRYPPVPAEVADVVQRLLAEGERIKVGPLSDKVISWGKVSERYLGVLAEAVGVMSGSPGRRRTP